MFTLTSTEEEDAILRVGQGDVFPLVESFHVVHVLVFDWYCRRCINYHDYNLIPSINLTPSNDLFTLIFEHVLQIGYPQ